MKNIITQATMLPTIKNGVVVRSKLIRYIAFIPFKVAESPIDTTIEDQILTMDWSEYISASEGWNNDSNVNILRGVYPAIITARRPMIEDYLDRTTMKHGFTPQMPFTLVDGDLPFQ